MIESATFWKDGPEIETGELVTEEIGTEVFFLPAASHVEKAGSFTQTQRMLQWRDKAVDPPGDCRSELQFYVDLGNRIREKLRGLDRRDGPPAARPGVGLPVRRAAASRTGERCCARSTAPGRTARPVGVHRAEGRRVDRVRVLDLLRGLRRRGEPGAAAQARTGSRTWSPRSGAGCGRPTAASSTTAPRRRPTARPWSERKKYVWWDAGAEEVDRARRARLHPRPGARPRPRGGRARARRHRRARPVHHADRRQGVALRAARRRRRADAHPLRAAGVTGGQPALRAAEEPVAAQLDEAANPINPSRARSSPTSSPATASPSTTPPAR